MRSVGHGTCGIAVLGNMHLRPAEKGRSGRGFRQTLFESIERLRVRTNGRAQEG